MFRPQLTSKPFPTFTKPSPPRRKVRPPNADPRARQRVSKSNPSATSLTFSTTKSVSSIPRFLNFPNPPTAEIPREHDRTVQQRSRKRLRVVIRPQVRIQQQQVTQSPMDFTGFDSSFKNRNAQNQQSVSVKENSLLKECLKQAMVQESIIEEMQNRTALHVKYAQERQTVIETLKNNLEVAKNQSNQDKKKIESFATTIQNVSEILKDKTENIQTLKNNSIELNKTHKLEQIDTQATLMNLTLNINNNVEEIAQLTIALKNQEKETDIQKAKLREARSNVLKLKTEKKNLLQIVQQLAEIGNPAIKSRMNFNSFMESEEDIMLEEERFENIDSLNDEAKKESKENKEMKHEIHEFMIEDETDNNEAFQKSVKETDHIFMPVRSL